MTAPLITRICTWKHHSHGQTLHCDELAVPGELFCADHLIERHTPPAVSS